ncbi:hypothetical protein [Paenibacillus bovis]|uniref:Knr4/Smi1-like domain-containing protein n=1 Tax=Paenibacillus bovis TaxID=1616788 RepID=A0A172ZKE7_9BACL|nr:hypothetical protein [Paenibacillus bovis]ANF97882.1 hypothetical protein AR543_18910 [Paenibacillus bovis]
MTDFSKLHTSILSFIQQQDLYNQSYGLFDDSFIRAYSEPIQLEIDDRIPLSPELHYLYSHFEMVDEKAAGSIKSAAVLIGNGILLNFAAPEYLYRQQLGYRWIGASDSPEESTNWPSHHVVIANYNDDPLIVDTSRADSPVYAAFEGNDPELVASSLANFFAALVIMIEAAAVLQGEITDEETDEIKTEYTEMIEPQLLELLGEQQMNDLFVYLGLNW